MLTIILTYKNTNTIDDINTFLTHINNIISNYDIILEILIINCNNEIKHTFPTLSTKIIKCNIFNYSCDYDDSIHNEILHNASFNNILYTDFNIYITDQLIEWITLNTINENTFIRTNIFNLNSIPSTFLHNYNNSIYNEISQSIKFICNENHI